MENALTGAMALKPFLQAALSGIQALSVGRASVWMKCEGDKHLPGLYSVQHSNKYTKWCSQRVTLVP